MSIQVSEQIIEKKDNKLSNQQQLELSLSQYFQKVFTRNALLNNAYYVFRMNSKLEIPLNAVFHDRGVKQITTDRKAVISALQKCSLVFYRDEEEVITPNLPQLRVKVTISNVQKVNFEPLQLFLQQKDPIFNDALYSFEGNEETGKCFLFFKDEESAIKGINLLESTQFKEQLLQSALEQENIYQTFTAYIQDQKKKTQPQEKPKETKNDHKNHKQAPLIQPLVYPINQFVPAAQQFPNLEIFGDSGDMFIRRSKEEIQSEQKKGDLSQKLPLSQQQQTLLGKNPLGMNLNMSAQQLAIQAQQLLMMQQMMQQQALQNFQLQYQQQLQQQQLLQQEMEENYYNQQNQQYNQQGGRRNNNHRRGYEENGSNNNKNNNNNNNNNGRRSNNNQRKNNNTQKGEVVYQRKNVEAKVNVGTSADNSNNTKNYQQENLNENKKSHKPNRLRIQSEEFPGLKEDPAELEKKLEQIRIKKVEDPNRSTFEHIYTRIDIIKYFEFVKNGLTIPQNLSDFQKVVPVINLEGTFQLEMERPTRKNSSLTPLLQPLSFRKGSTSIGAQQYRKKSPPRQKTESVEYRKKTPPKPKKEIQEYKKKQNQN